MAFGYDTVVNGASISMPAFFLYLEKSAPLARIFLQSGLLSGLPCQHSVKQSVLTVLASFWIELGGSGRSRRRFDHSGGYGRAVYQPYQRFINGWEDGYGPWNRCCNGYWNELCLRGQPLLLSLPVSCTDLKIRSHHLNFVHQSSPHSSFSQSSCRALLLV